MTKLILIRHGEAEGNINRRFHGSHNSDLTDNGLEQIKLAALRLKDEHIDAIYSSDLNRAFFTASAVAMGRDEIEVAQLKALREIDGGDWEGVLWDELPERFPESYGAWLNDPQRLQMPGGESMVEFQARCYRAVEEILSRHKGKTVLIATHGTVIKVLLAKYTGKSLSELPNMTWHDNASITLITFDDNHTPTLVREGDNAHLGERSTLAKQSWWRKKLIEGGA